MYFVNVERGKRHGIALSHELGAVDGQVQINHSAAALYEEVAAEEEESRRLLQREDTVP